MSRIAVRGSEFEVRPVPPAAGAPWVAWPHGPACSMAGEDRYMAAGESMGCATALEAAIAATAADLATWMDRILDHVEQR